MPSLDEVLEDREHWADDLELDRLDTYMWDSTMRKMQRSVAVDWTMAHGDETLQPDPPTLGQVRELFAGGYAFRSPDGAHARSHISASWHARRGDEAQPGHVPTKWIQVAG